MDEIPRAQVHWNVLKYDLARVAARDRWGAALMVIGGEHLAFCLVYQAYYSPDSRRAALFLSLWAVEVVTLLVTMRAVSGKGWHRATPLAGILVRVWATFLILSFSVASLNGLTGFTVDWFKLVWCTLSSFGFATTAWLLGPWFIVFAFQMYFTGLLMLFLPAHAYVIHGTSWFLALQVIGVALERGRRARLRAPEVSPQPFRKAEAETVAA